MITAGAVVLVLGLVWLLHSVALRKVAEWVIPWWVSASSGYNLTIGQTRAGLLRPVVLSELKITGADGTNLSVREATLDWAGAGSWGLSPASWFRRVALQGLAGQVGAKLPARRPTSSDAMARPPGVAAKFRLPPCIEAKDADLKIVGGRWSLDLRGTDLVLNQEQTGHLQIREAIAKVGGYRRTFRDLKGVTGWRDGVAYFAELEIDDNVTIDEFSTALTGPASLALKARAFGGYAYADLAIEPGSGVKAAVNAVQLSLQGFAEFSGLAGDMSGKIDLAKLTFNGDPSDPLSGQISLRIEAGDFAWQKTAAGRLVLGLSVAGRHLRVNECKLRQKANDVSLCGTVSLPTEPGAWRDAPFEFDVDADVGNLRALAGLFGPPWNGLSGGLRVEGKGSGKAANGQGWLKVRGWDLTARGVPAGSLQADLKLEGRDLVLTGLDAQSGANFARGAGNLTLDDSLAYRGRLELRVRDVARYLEPLGRFAPDWAREGGVLLFWDGDGTPSAHSGVATLELVQFTGDLNPVPLNGKISGSYSPGNIYVNRILLDRGPLSLSSSLYFGEKGLSVQDMQLFSGRSRLLRGEIFLPLSLEAVLARKPWEETVMTDRELYAFVRSDELDLGKLVELFGQETTLRGKADLRLDASGPFEKAVVDGSLSVSLLRASFPSWRIPDGRASLALQVNERRAAVAVQVHPDTSSAAILRADVPLIGRSDDGKWTLIDYAKPWTATLEIPPTDLAGFSPKIHGAAFTRGLLRGKLAAANTLAAPSVEGSLEWKDGVLDLPDAWSKIDNIQARAVFSGTKAVLEETRGRMGEGTLGMAGSVDFADRRNPVWEILLRGEKLQAYDNDVLRLVCRPDIEARGNRKSGEIKGAVGLDGSSVVRSIAIKPTPSVATNPAPIKPPRWSDAPFPHWKLDLKMSSDGPLALPEGGTASPDLHLQGTTSDPLLLGTLQADKLPVSFPSRGRLAVSGRIHFTAEKPWVPILDLTGSGEAGPFDLRAGAFGPLDERKMLISSMPPLKLEQLVVMLSTGVSPVPAGQPDIAEPTPAAKLNSDPSWLDLQKIRGLFGWGTEENPDNVSAQWNLGSESIGYEWDWK